MKKIYLFLISFFVFSFQVKSQQLYVGNGVEFYLKKDMDFTTSNTVVTMGNTGLFSIESGSDWGSPSEYVNGKVKVYGNGTTRVPVGNNAIYAPVSIIHNSDISAQYFNAPPSSGTAGNNVDAISTEEYWQLTGQGVLTLPWNTHSDITTLVNNNGGELNALAVVGLEGTVWNLVSDPLTNTVTGDLNQGTVSSDPNNAIIFDTYSQMTIGIDHQALLTADDLFKTNDIIVISTPISKEAGTIKFLSDNITGLEIEIYDILGRLINSYDNITIAAGMGAIEKPNVTAGLYFLKFSYNGKSGVRKVLIE